VNIVRQIRALLRKFIDSFYCRPLSGKRKIGTIDSWYVLTGNLRNAVIYSGGVGKDITFEMELYREFNAQIFLFDPSPTGIQTIKSLNLPSNISYYPVGLAGEDGELAFASPLKPEEGSFRIGDTGVKFKCRKISTLLRENQHSSVELLKIDIEGFEYEVIEDIVDSRVDIRQIAVEFHDFYPNIRREKTLRAIELLKENGYILYHKRGHDYSFKRSD
jgi:FkbM family methyltransferase